MTRGRKVAFLTVAVALVAGLIFSILFILASRSTKAEWASRQTKHSAVEQRSILNAIRNFAAEPPNFLPLSGLDNEMCAASVVNAVNFIRGEDYLKATAAWTFGRDNADKLEVVYDRSKDFLVMGTRVAMRQLRQIDIRDYFKDDAIYILGYHYKETGSDEKIIAAGSGLNSHLMLLLGDQDGELVGYHLIHYSNDYGRNPVKVETLASVLPLLDLVYVWKVKGPTLPKEAPNVALINATPPYTEVRDWIGIGPRLTEYYFDTVSVWMHSLVNGSQQFPIIVPLDQDVVEVPSHGPKYHGRVRGFYNGVPVYTHVGHSVRGEYGLQFQCVEFINRYYVSLGFDNLTQTGDADSYYWDADAKKLDAFANGGKVGPEIDDILVFDRAKDDGDPGHVAIIYSVTDKYLCFVQQNAGKWRDCLPLENRSGRYTVRLPNEKIKNYPARPIGWSRWK